MAFDDRVGSRLRLGGLRPALQFDQQPGAGPDLWIVALILTGFSAIFTGVNLVSTIYYLRAPGMTMFRMRSSPGTCS